MAASTRASSADGVLRLFTAQTVGNRRYTYGVLPAPYLYPAAPLHVVLAGSMATPATTSHQGQRFAWLAALGIVFGDLGTSPLYALQECFAGANGANPQLRDDVLGTVSLIVWSLLFIVTIKYLVFLMRIDNRGEGGILALLGLLKRGPRDGGAPRASLLGVVLAIVGASLLFGDGVITPAVSVLSAVEGLGVATPAFEPYVLWIAIAILLALFAVQARGTEKLGRAFGPIMLLWFFAAFALGAWHLRTDLSVLSALSPVAGARFFQHHGFRGIHLLGGVVLAVTGGEALYADMGHFGRKPIQTAWIFVCLPALVVCYLGQAAFVLQHPESASRPFFAMCPRGPLLYALVALAGAATVIASQALISGVFSLTRQAIQLGYFPRLTVTHTSASSEGQIYVPAMNAFLAVACIAVVLGFRESSKLAAAYGIAVSGTMAITSVLFFLVVRERFGWSMARALPVLMLFLAVDIPFVAANAGKILDGGWLPLVIGSVFTGLMLLWSRGRRLLGDYFAARQGSLDELLRGVQSGSLRSLPGVAVFMASSAVGAPLPLSHIARRFGSIYETNVLLTVANDAAAHVAGSARVEASRLGSHVVRVILHYGFMETPSIVADLDAALASLGVASPSSERCYFLGRETITPTGTGKMGIAEETLFAFLSRNAKSPTDWFGLPPEQVTEIGMQVDL